MHGTNDTSIVPLSEKYRSIETGQTHSIFFKTPWVKFEIFKKPLGARKLGPKSLLALRWRRKCTSLLLCTNLENDHIFKMQLSPVRRLAKKMKRCALPWRTLLNTFQETNIICLLMCSLVYMVANPKRFQEGLWPLSPMFTKSTQTLLIKKTIPMALVLLSASSLTRTAPTSRSGGLIRPKRPREPPKSFAEDVQKSETLSPTAHIRTKC